MAGDSTVVFCPISHGTSGQPCSCAGDSTSLYLRHVWGRRWTGPLGGPSHQQRRCPCCVWGEGHCFCRQLDSSNHGNHLRGPLETSVSHRQALPHSARNPNEHELINCRAAHGPSLSHNPLHPLKNPCTGNAPRQERLGLAAQGNALGLRCVLPDSRAAWAQVPPKSASVTHKAPHIAGPCCYRKVEATSFQQVTRGPPLSRWLGVGVGSQKSAPAVLIHTPTGERCRPLSLQAFSIIPPPPPTCKAPGSTAGVSLDRTGCETSSGKPSVVTAGGRGSRRPGLFPLLRPDPRSRRSRRVSVHVHTHVPRCLCAVPQTSLPHPRQGWASLVLSLICHFLSSDPTYALFPMETAGLPAEIKSKCNGTKRTGSRHILVTPRPTPGSEMLSLRLRNKEAKMSQSSKAPEAGRPPTRRDMPQSLLI